MSVKEVHQVFLYPASVRRRTLNVENTSKERQVRRLGHGTLKIRAKKDRQDWGFGRVAEDANDSQRMIQPFMTRKDTAQLRSQADQSIFIMRYETNPLAALE